MSVSLVVVPAAPRAWLAIVFVSLNAYDNFVSDWPKRVVIVYERLFLHSGDGDVGNMCRRGCRAERLASDVPVSPHQDHHNRPCVQTYPSRPHGPQYVSCKRLKNGLRWTNSSFVRRSLYHSPFVPTPSLIYFSLQPVSLVQSAFDGDGFLSSPFLPGSSFLTPFGHPHGCNYSTPSGPPTISRLSSTVQASPPTSVPKTFPFAVSASSLLHSHLLSTSFPVWSAPPCLQPGRDSIQWGISS